MFCLKPKWEKASCVPAAAQLATGSSLTHLLYNNNYFFTLSVGSVGVLKKAVYVWASFIHNLYLKLHVFLSTNVLYSVSVPSVIEQLASPRSITVITCSSGSLWRQRASHYRTPIFVVFAPSLLNAYTTTGSSSLLLDAQKYLNALIRNIR